MRRSSAGPLRVRNEADAPGGRSRIPTTAAGGRNSRLSAGSSRSSLGGGRPSLSQVSRPQGRQSVGQGTSRTGRASTRTYGGGDLKKDPRCINDRHVKDKCIRELIEFLQENNYPHPCSIKILHSPSSKEFIHIFEFKYGIIEPGFKCSSKIEEQFPHLLKSLGYPFSISKSAMYAIGSPHTWPTLLGALTWLREQIMDTMATDVEKIMFPNNQDDFDSVPMTKIVFQYCAMSYMQFLQGADTFEELEADLEKEMRKYGNKDDMESLTHEHRRLEQELLSLQEEQDPMIQMKDRLASMRLDGDKVQQYIQTLQTYQTTQTAALDNLELESRSLESEIAVLSADVRKKQHILDTQTFSQADVQRINTERMARQQQMESLEDENQTLQTACWEQERELAKRQEMIQKNCMEYNRLLQVLQLSNPTLRERGADFELKGGLEESQSRYLEGSILPGLTQMKTQCVDDFNQLKEEEIIGKANLDQLNDLILDNNNSLVAQEKKLQNMALELERQKTMQQTEIQRLEGNIDFIESDIKTLRANKSLDLPQLERNIMEEGKKFAMVCAEHKKEEKNFQKFLFDIMDMIIEHKATIQDHTKKLHAESEQRLENVRQQVEQDLEELLSDDFQ